MTEHPLTARVLIDGPSELVFDYAVPAGMPVAAGCRVRVPLRARDATGTVLAVAEGAPDLGFALREVKALSEPEPLVTPALLELGRWIADYYGCSMETVMRALLPEAVRTEDNSAKTRKVLVLERGPAPEVLARLAKRAPRQHAILVLLEQAAERRMALADFGEAAAPAARALAKAGLLRVIDEEVRRDPEADGTEVVASVPLALNPEQAAALAAVQQAMATPEPRPILLHGVTGSGKTEVYLQAAAHALATGRTVLVLVPEISLTPQTVRRFRSRFAHLKDQVAVLHSHLSQGERFDEWHRIRKGVARIVIGARSAVFAPLPDLGLIIVDEEHENTYKQENPPRYHGRDVAVLRARFERCAVVLGSATPSLESYHNTLAGKYQLLRLNQRADDRSMPLVRVVDMRLEARKQQGRPGDSIRKAAHGDRAAPRTRRAGDPVPEPPRLRPLAAMPGLRPRLHLPALRVALTYHREDERLICHVCGHQAVVPRKCPACRDPAIILQGYGTQKVEDVLHKVFPQARLARIDADTMRRKHALRDTLNAFKAHKIDMLVGTQMIAKGLHFPNVTLVGILNADLSLHVPDFRAGERTFQLLTQVAGRAGRGEVEGEVLVQTFTPHSPSIQFARHHDFDGFARAGTRVPPPVRLPAVRALRGAHRPLDPRAARRVHLADASPAARRGPARRDFVRRAGAVAAGQGARAIPLPDHPARRQAARPLAATSNRSSPRPRCRTT